MSEAEPPAGAGIAVIGLAARLPGAAEVEAFWSDLLAGVEAITRYSPDELLAAGVPSSLVSARDYVPAKGALEDADCFDAAFFGIAPRSAELMDPQQRLFLECAWQALEDAGYPEEPPGQRIGVFAGGAAMSSYYHLHLLAQAETVADVDPFQLFLLNQPAGLPTQVAYRLDLTGPALALQTACSTGLAAVAVASQNLLDLQCDVAIAGASALSLPLSHGYHHQPGSILSADGHCRPFDAAATGTVPGNGVGAVVLKRLADAVADGDRIDAVIRGFAMNNDGQAKIGFTAPSVSGQAQVIADALAMAELEPAAIDYVEAHGTATPLGDAIELEALRQVFAGVEPGRCLLGSVKGNIGHLDAAAGIAGLIKVVLALRHRVLPPSLNFRSANPELRLEGSPFAVQAEAGDWRPHGQARRAGVSSFGMGGTNVHVVLEEAPSRADAPAALPFQLLPLSAASEASLRRRGKRLADLLAAPAAPDLSAVAWTLQSGHKALGQRLAVAVRTPTEAAQRLREAVLTAGDDATPPVFLFPGQGAQHAGMAAALEEALPSFAEPLELACAGFASLGIEIRPLLRAGRDESDANRQLSETLFAQPALFAVEYALAQFFIACGVRPVACLGHSVGEYAAACVADVFDLDAALRIVAARARSMQELPRGAMLSVRMEESELRSLLPEEVEIAVFNAPGLTVIAGEPEAIGAATETITRAGGLCRPLRTSHAFHSAMMGPAVAPFLAQLRQEGLRGPAIPLVSNLSGTWLGEGQARDPAFWAQQIRAPVRFADGLATLLAAGHRRFVELGPGGGLSTLVARQGTTARCWTSLAPASEDEDLRALLETLGGLWASGHPLDWRPLWPAGTPTRVALPPYPFERVRHWVPAPGADDAGSTTPRPEVSVDPVSAVGTDAEEAVIALWKRHLGHDSIGPDDSFHRLGGDSLLAVRLAAELNRSFPAAALQPQDLLRCPTPRLLAVRLSCPPEGRDPASPLLVLRAGQPEKRPLVLFHAVGGTIDLYGELIAMLDPAVPVYAFQSRLLADGQPGSRTVEGMARDYLTDLAKLQDQGPYRLLGSSFGGMLAFEAARQLLAAGERVELLSLLDTPGPGDLPRALADDADVLSYIARILGHPLDAESLRAMEPGARLDRFVSALAARLPAGITGADFAVYLEAFKLNTEAMRAYEPELPLGMPRILFLKARERDADTPATPERAWRALLGEAGLKVVETPGNHISMMQGTNVSAIAELLAPLLR